MAESLVKKGALISAVRMSDFMAIYGGKSGNLQIHVEEY